MVIKTSVKGGVMMPWIRIPGYASRDRSETQFLPKVTVNEGGVNSKYESSICALGVIVTLLPIGANRLNAAWFSLMNLTSTGSSEPELI